MRPTPALTAVRAPRTSWPRLSARPSVAAAKSPAGRRSCHQAPPLNSASSNNPCVQLCADCLSPERTKRCPERLEPWSIRLLPDSPKRCHERRVINDNRQQAGKSSNRPGPGLGEGPEEDTGKEPDYERHPCLFQLAVAVTEPALYEQRSLRHRAQGRSPRRRLLRVPTPQRSQSTPAA